MKKASKDGKRSVEEYNASKRFDMLSIGDVEKLVKKRTTEDKPILYFIANEELYSKIQEIHVILLGIVLNVIDDKYRIGTVVGCFVKLFACNQVEMCTQKLQQEANVADRVLSLRAVVAEDSVGTRQGLIPCNCKTGCSAARYKCK